MKKIFLGLFICLSLACLLFIGVKTHAETGLTITDGASMRTAGEHQGLRFSANVSSLDGITEHGFYIAKGTHTKDDITTAIVGGTGKVAGNNLLKKIVEGSDLDFHIVIYNMDDLGKYAQPITVLAYVYDGSSYTYTNAVTRNLADIARADYNTHETPATLVTTVAEAAKVKVTHSDSSVDYYGSLAAASAAFADGDTVDLVKGTYDDALTIGVNDFKIRGAHSGKLVQADGTRSNGFDETILSNTVVLSDAVENVTIDGLKFTGESMISMAGSNSHITLKYCNSAYTGHYGINQSDAEKTLTDLVLLKNHFYSTNAEYSVDVNLLGTTDGISVTQNRFKNDLTSLSEVEIESTKYFYDYAIKLTKPKGYSSIDIKDNNFEHQGSYYVLAVGEGLTAVRAYTANIINNSFSLDDTVLKGNCMCFLYKGNTGSINIVHNTNINTSTYFNAIVISNTDKASGTTSTVKPVVNILYNQFNWMAMDKPSFRNATENEYTRIAICLSVESTITIKGNYYSSGSSTYAFTTMDSNSNTQGSYFKNEGSATLKGVTGTINETNYAYEAYNYLYELSQYDGELTGVNAWYGGTGANNIKNYIPSFASKHADKLEIQDGALVYVIAASPTSTQIKVWGWNGISEADESVKP